MKNVLLEMKKPGLVILALLAANTLYAQTSPLSYDYVGASLGTGDILEEDFSFYGLNAAYSVNENIFVLGSYYDGSTDDDVDFGFGSSKIELSGYDAGIGFHTPVSETIDFVATASYISRELELFGFSEDGDGYGIHAGLRFKATERLELNAFAVYSDLEGEGETGYTASAYYFLTPTFSVGLAYAEQDETDTVAGNIRLHF